MDASTWFASMSASRSFCFQQPGRISSNVTGVTSSSSKPTAADNLGNGYTRSSYNHQSHHSPSSTPFSKEKTPPLNENLALSRTTFGARSANLPVMREVQRSGGSTTWSSTEMMRGISGMGLRLERVLVCRHALHDRQSSHRGHRGGGAGSLGRRGGGRGRSRR